MKIQLFTALLTASVLSTPAAAQNMQDNLPSYEDGAYVMLSGTARDIDDDEFDLHYDGGMIAVEMDDWEFDADLENYIREGEKVVVSGTLEDNWFTDREIAANNIFVDRNLTYYYVYDIYPAYSGQSEESQNQSASETDYEDGPYVTSRGTVQNINESQFTLQSNGQNLTVSVDGLSYNPFNDNGISVGDRVFVSGEMDQGFFDNRELEADFVVATKQVDQKTSAAASNDADQASTQTQ